MLFQLLLVQCHLTSRCNQSMSKLKTNRIMDYITQRSFYLRVQGRKSDVDVTTYPKHSRSHISNVPECVKLNMQGMHGCVVHRKWKGCCIVVFHGGNEGYFSYVRTQIGIIIGCMKHKSVNLFWVHWEGAKISNRKRNYHGTVKICHWQIKVVSKYNTCKTSLTS